MRKALLVIGVWVFMFGLSACGGDLDSPPPIIPIPSPTPEPLGDEIDLLDGSFTWQADPGNLVLQDDLPDGAIRYEPTAADQQLRTILPGATVLQDAEIQMSFEVDDAFEVGDGDFQVIVQQDFSPYNGFFGCFVDHSQFDGGARVVTLDGCIASNPALDVSPPDGAGWRVGISSSSSEASFGGGITITSAVVVLAEASGEPQPIVLDLTESGNWEIDNATGPVYSDDGVSFGPTGVANSQSHQLRVIFSGPTGNLNNATLDITVEADEDFINSNVGLQAIVQYNQDPFGGFFGCDINASAYDDNGEATVTCNTGSNGLNFEAPSEGLRVGIQASSGEPTPLVGNVKIKSFVIRPSAP